MKCFSSLRACVQVIDTAKEVLKLEPKHAKALFRLSQAYLSQHEPERCREALEQWRAVEPDSASLRELEGRLKQEVASQAAKERQMFGNIFSKDSK